MGFYIFALTWRRRSRSDMAGAGGLGVSATPIAELLNARSGCGVGCQRRCNEAIKARRCWRCEMGTVQAQHRGLVLRHKHC